MNLNVKNLNSHLNIINRELMNPDYYRLNAISPIDKAVEFFDDLGIHTFYIDYSGATFYLTYEQSNYLIQYDLTGGFTIESEVGRLDEI